MTSAHDKSCAQQRACSSEQVNIGPDERLLSKIVGGGLVFLGLDQRSFPGLMLAAFGSALLYRGVTGNCHVYRALGIDTSEHEHRNVLNQLEPGEAMIGSRR